MSVVLSIDEKVLVLNRGYAAIRVVPARDAFTLLCRKAAEILSIEDGNYMTYGLMDWMDVAKLQKEFEPEQHRWLRLPALEIAVRLKLGRMKTKRGRAESALAMPALLYFGI